MKNKCSNLSKILFIFLFFLFQNFAFAGDVDLKTFLVGKTYALCYTFNPNGTYHYHCRVIGGSVVCDGKYEIKNNKLYFLTTKIEDEDSYSTEFIKNVIHCSTPYRYDPEIMNLFYKGALINENDGHLIWSEESAPAYAKINHEGIDCIRYPWRNKGFDNEYILIKENLKAREKPSTDSNLVSVFGFQEDNIYYYKSRHIVFAGQTCTIRAKTIEQDTIDGITAPWYLIYIYGIQEEGVDAELAWVFGGYVEVIKQNQLEEYDAKYKSLLKQSVINAGGEVW